MPARLAADAGELAAFAVRAMDGGLRVCLINTDFTRDVRVTIDPGRRFAVASVLRLSGPVVDATAGVTLGGGRVDDFGRWAPVTAEAVPSAAREYAVDVPAASAALVSLAD